MGDFLTAVTSRISSPEALAHRISLRIATSKKYAFITESGDDIFFYSAISARLGVRRHFDYFPAHGRPNVIKVFRILKSLQKISKCYGIIDRDYNFEDPIYLFDGHCLVLDVYSYENYLLDYEALCEVGAQLLTLEPGSDASGDWFNFVQAFIDSLPITLRQEHAIALWCRQNGKNCYLNNFKITQHIEINNDGSLSERSNISEVFLIETSADIAGASHENLAEAARSLSECALNARYRGHYFWSLFVKLLNTYRQKLDDELRRQQLPRARTRQVINERHAIEAAVSVLNIPPTVETFIRNIIIDE